MLSGGPVEFVVTIFDNAAIFVAEAKRQDREQGLAQLALQLEGPPFLLVFPLKIVVSKFIFLISAASNEPHHRSSDAAFRLPHRCRFV
jgi:hypothetical protein